MLLSRRTQVAVLLAALFASISPAVNAQAINVTVDGQPLYMNPGPIERNGRVFVPMRAIFERLGAAVVYNAGTINATKGSTTVSLRIGSTQATVNGQPQILDVAPFIVGATTYVPLRFVAQSLGATVNYESSTRTVSILSGAPGPRPPAPRPPPIPPPVRPERIFLDINTPRAGATVGRTFVIRGNTVRNARITVTAGASSSATGQFNGATTADGRGDFGIQVAVTAPPGQQSVRVRVTARDPITSRSTDLTLQLRLTPLTR